MCVYVGVYVCLERGMKKIERMIDNERESDKKNLKVRERHNC